MGDCRKAVVDHLARNREGLLSGGRNLAGDVVPGGSSRGVAQPSVLYGLMRGRRLREWEGARAGRDVYDNKVG